MGRLVYRNDQAVELTKAWLSASGERPAPNPDEVIEAYHKFLKAVDDNEDGEEEKAKG